MTGSRRASNPCCIAQQHEKAWKLQQQGYGGGGETPKGKAFGDAGICIKVQLRVELDMHEMIRTAENVSMPVWASDSSCARGTEGLLLDKEPLSMASER